MPPSSASETETRFSRMITRVTLTVISISAALLFVIIYAGLSMSRTIQDRQARLIDAALTESVNDTLMQQMNWAFRDETARMAQHRPPPREWFDHNVGVGLTEGNRQERVFLISPDDLPVYGYGEGRRRSGTELAPLWQAIQPMIREIRTGLPRGYTRRDEAFGIAPQRYRHLPAARHGRWAANLLRDERGPVIVSLMTIVPTADTRLAVPRPYLLLSTARIGPTAVQKIGNQLLLPDLQFLPRPSLFSRPIPLRTDDNRIAAYMHWYLPDVGMTLIRRVLPIFAILLVVGLLHSRLMLRSLRVAHRRLEDEEASSRFLALHDALSELPNRRNFMGALSERLQELSRGGEADRVCVAYLDVDRFKNVNDAIGHGAGDALVAQIGPRLRGVLREGDLLARLGGDEFAVLRTLDPGEDPQLLGGAILSAFGQPFLIDGNPLEVTASIGIAVAQGGELDPEQVLRHADISLYKAKDEGRNRYALFEADMAEQVRARHEIEVELRGAIGTRQIAIHYQPIISARDGGVVAFEALVRWFHPRHGLIPPADFIPIAEQTGLMVPLGDHILEKVFRELAGLGGHAVAINLSPLQLRHRGLPERLSRLARRFDVDPRRIILEVTETMLVEANEVTAELFERLRELGFRRALDDFGTGYSSLSYLSRFDFDKIKIDRSFVSCGARPEARAILEGIVHIGRGLGVDIVAEGVETAAELAMIQSLGITEAQGYHIAAPMPLHAVPAFLNRQAAIVFPPPELQLVTNRLAEPRLQRAARSRSRAG